MLISIPRPTPPLPPPIRPVASTSVRPPVVKRRRPGAAKKAKGAKRARLPVRKELSAGGVVVRQQDNVWYVALLKTEHKRGEVWVLPKGHVELHTGERVSDAARREVQEEAGLRDLSVKNQLGVTRFKFQAENTLVYKTVHYFLMVTQQKQLQPQAEEGLLEAAWFPIDQAIKHLEYDTDQDIVQRAAERLRGEALPSRQLLRTPRTTAAPSKRPRRSTRIHT